MSVQRNVSVCWVKFMKTGELVKEQTTEIQAALPQRGAKKFFDRQGYEVFGAVATPNLEAKIHIFVKE